MSQKFTPKEQTIDIEKSGYKLLFLADISFFYTEFLGEWKISKRQILPLLHLREYIF